MGCAGARRGARRTARAAPAVAALLASALLALTQSAQTAALSATAARQQPAQPGTAWGHADPTLPRWHGLHSSRRQLLAESESESEDAEKEGAFRSTARAARDALAHYLNASSPSQLAVHLRLPGHAASSGEEGSSVGTARAGAPSGSASGSRTACSVSETARRSRARAVRAGCDAGPGSSGSSSGSSSVSSTPPPSRGIVMPAGGAVLLTNAYVVIKVLREHLNCTLPIAVVYNGPREMDAATKQVLESRWPNVTCMDASNFSHPLHVRAEQPVDHFAFKAFAFYHAPFEQVFMLDADSLPLADPACYFESAEFIEDGNLFWPDFMDEWPAKAYELFNLTAPQPTGRAPHGTESGQFAFDRRRLADVAHWVWFLNAHGPDGIYKYMWGDKDTFQLAFALAGKEHAFRQVPHCPREALCDVEGSYRGEWHGHIGMLQADAVGQPAFLHRTNIGKFRPNALDGEWACFNADWATVPLCDARARVVHEIGIIPFKVTTVADFDAAGKCHNWTSAVSYHEECGIDPAAGDMPVATLPMAAFGEGVEAVIKASYAAYDEAVALYRAGEMLVGACQGYRVDSPEGMVC